MLAGGRGAADGGDVAALQHLWTGVRDSSEQVVMSLERRAALWPQQSERRVRTVVAPVASPWLGAHVLYLEEFLEDQPEAPRRQLLHAAGASARPEHAVHVRLFTFLAPQRWTHLNYRPALLASWCGGPGRSSGCDLLLARAGDQFHGGTLGRHCLDTAPARRATWTTSCVISQDLYWYRRRVLRQSDGELQQEIIGFNRFEPNEARLFACRVAWSASGGRRDLQPLLTLDLYEEGGRGQFVTPDGRTFELTLHGRDWPFALDRDALHPAAAGAGPATPPLPAPGRSWTRSASHSSSAGCRCAAGRSRRTRTSSLSERRAPRALPRSFSSSG